MKILSRMRILLLPISALVHAYAFFRNLAFDMKWKAVFEIPGKSITIGNLSTGGTGKSPHTLYINTLIQQSKPTAILSRGYGRKTSGLIKVHSDSTPEEIGDEPKMFQLSAPNTPIYVSEKRKIGVEAIRQDQPENTVILLDDAFQHRYVRAGFQILLTDFYRPYFADFLLPAGDLREPKSGRHRADMVVITKCPDGLIDSEKNLIRQLAKHPEVYFSSFEYAELSPYHNPEQIAPQPNCLLVCGIAQPKPLIAHLSKMHHVESILLPDHSEFGATEIKRIRHKFDKFADGNKMLVITEKDAVKLDAAKASGALDGLPIFVQKISVKIDNEEKFKEKIQKYVREI